MVCRAMPPAADRRCVRGERQSSGHCDEAVRHSRHRKPQSGGVHWHSYPVVCVSWSHDGRRVSSGSDDQTVRVWDVEKEEAVSKPLQSNNESFFCVSWSLDYKRVASGALDGTLRVWDVEKCEAIG